MSSIAAPETDVSAHSKATTDDLTKVMVLLQTIPGAHDRCERYYTDVHVGLIRSTLRDDPRWVSYHQDRFAQQYDAAGGFAKDPERWRMVVLRGRVEQQEQGLVKRPNTVELQRVVELDHQNFVGDLARLEVVEETLHCSLGRQVALQKYSIIYLRSKNDIATDLATVDSAARELVRLARLAPGLRLALANQVTGQLENAMVGASLVPIPRYIPTPAVSGVLELWFDNRFSGDEFFALEPVRDLLHYGAVPIEAYKVLQTAGFDKRDLVSENAPIAR